MPICLGESTESYAAVAICWLFSACSAEDDQYVSLTALRLCNMYWFFAFQYVILGYNVACRRRYDVFVNIVGMFPQVWGPQMSCVMQR